MRTTIALTEKFGYPAKPYDIEIEADVTEDYLLAERQTVYSVDVLSVHVVDGCDDETREDIEHWLTTDDGKQRMVDSL